MHASSLVPTDTRRTNTFLPYFERLIVMNTTPYRLAAWSLLTAAVFVATATAQTVKLLPPEPVKLSNGQVIDVLNAGFASPHYRDMDGDEIPDLLVGELGLDALRVYTNHGTAHEPLFTGFDLLKTTEGIALTDVG